MPAGLCRASRVVMCMISPAPELSGVHTPGQPRPRGDAPAAAVRGARAAPARAEPRAGGAAEPDLEPAYRGARLALSLPKRRSQRQIAGFGPFQRRFRMERLFKTPFNIILKDGGSEEAGRVCHSAL